MAGIKIHERVITYEVGLLPPDHIDAQSFAITVEYRGPDAWAVLRRQQCLGADGEWEWEPRPSEREDDWLATHRFPLEKALALARVAAPDVTVNGRTAQVAAKLAKREEV